MPKAFVSSSCYSAVVEIVEKVGLVNFNRRGVLEPGVPPVAPIGLEYLVTDLVADGHDVALLDLHGVPKDEWSQQIEHFVESKTIIGVTFRNFGVDSLWLQEDWFFLPQLKAVIDLIRRHTKIPIVLGGQGFSIYPKRILEETGADFGVVGPGALAFLKIVRSHRTMVRGTLHSAPINANAVHSRALIDNAAYIRNGGILAVNTKTGCHFKCAFCVESGKPIGLRNLDAVIEEIYTLLKYYETAGCSHPLLFIADAEFNSHRRQAEEFCDRVIAENLRFSWTCYLNTIPMTARLATKMKQAGCVNPCVSMISGSAEVLLNMQAKFSVDDIRETANILNEVGLSYTVDVMLGAPGDSLSGAIETFNLLEEIRPSVIGLNYGVRLYANTSLGQDVLNGKYDLKNRIYGITENNKDLFYPIFYAAGEEIADYFKEICDTDPRYQLLGHRGFGGVNYPILSSPYNHSNNQ